MVTVLSTIAMFEWSFISLTGLIFLAYCGCVVRTRAKGKTWPGRRIILCGFGAACVLVALSPTVAAFAHADPRGHMLQHLLLGMLAPLGFVLAAPATLLLRALPRSTAKSVTRILQSRPVAVVTHPVTALVVSIGSMYLLYLTPLYRLSLDNPFLHAWLHLHFMVAGCIFTWSVVGVDRSSHRASHQTRLIVLFFAIAAHSLLAKFMYAYGYGWDTGYSAESLQAAAKLMYYGGDCVEFILVLVLLASWKKDSVSQSENSIFTRAGAYSRIS